MKNREYKLDDAFYDDTIIFNDDDVLIKSKSGETSYKYSAISDVKISKMNTRNVFFKLDIPSSLVKRSCYIDFEPEKFGERDELYKFISDKVNKVQEEKFKESQKEHVIKCNICGNVFAYTGAEIEKNKQNESSALLAEGLSLISGIFGTKYDMYEQQKKADNLNSQIKDFSRCPKCNSKNIVEIDPSEEKNINQVNHDIKTNNFEEVKKFKELLDMGIITQEEYDKKKKELLNL